MPVSLEPVKTEQGYRLGDFEILFGEGGKGRKLRANTLLLHGPRPIVVDAAAQEERHRELSGQNPILFFTHYHADHRAAEHCYEKTAETWASAADASAFGDSGDFMRRIDERLARGPQQMFQMLTIVYKISNREIAREVRPDEWIEAGGCRAQSVALPGHTPGHSGLYFPEQSLFFLTDIDLTPFGPWYGNDVSSIPAFKASIARARRVEARWYFTSHGEKLLERERYLEKLEKFEAHFERRDGMLLDALSQGEKSLDELSRLGLVYRPEKLQRNENLMYFEKKHVRKHLELLSAAGAVQASEGFERFRLR